MAKSLGECLRRQSQTLTPEVILFQKHVQTMSNTKPLLEFECRYIYDHIYVHLYGVLQLAFSFKKIVNRSI